MSLRCGITTGTCAAAAAKAAAMVLTGGSAPNEIELRLPSGTMVRVPVLGVQHEPGSPAATASVRKDAGDDPDVTDGLAILVTLTWDDAGDVTFVAGEGVGTVTKPGLQVPPGQPAINPVPRRMIAAAIREVTDRGVRVEISIPGGREIAAKTFNPRLGIDGGLSILGTTGIVRPYCTRALQDALRCALDVAAACGVTAPILVPGNIGAQAASRHFSLGDQQVIEVGNEWGFSLDLLSGHAFHAVLLVGHPGKLAKLAAGQWDTHSSRSDQAIHYLNRLCEEILGHAAPDCTTTDGMFAALASEEKDVLARELAMRVRLAVASRLAKDLSSPARGERTSDSDNFADPDRFAVAVFLVDMAGECLGRDGDFSPWQ
jgi:cobalt-precorrin-5B (C1)-methyltransferase